MNRGSAIEPPKRQILLSVILVTSHFYLPVSPRIYLWHITFSILAAIPVMQYKDRVKLGWEKWLNSGLALWILGALLSSRINNLNVMDSLVLLLQPISILVALTALKKIVLGYNISLFKVMLCVAISGTASEYSLRTPLSSYNLWKYGIGMFVSLGILLLGSKYVKNRILYAAVLFACSLVSIFFEFRMLASVLFLTLIIAFPIKKKVHVSDNLIGESSKIGFLKVALFIFATYLLYLVLALRGVLGATEATRAQLLTTNLGPLAGRSEFLFSFSAFSSKPFFGYGNLANVSPEFLTNLAYKANGFLKYPTVNSLPVHSFLMQSLVLTGILSILFWVVFQVIVIKNLKNIQLTDFSLTIPIIFLTGYTIWGVYFSPLNNNERFMIALLVTSIIKVQSSQESKVKHSSLYGT